MLCRAVDDMVVCCLVVVCCDIMEVTLFNKYCCPDKVNQDGDHAIIPPLFSAPLSPFD